THTHLTCRRHPHVFFFITRPPPRPTLFPYTTLFRSPTAQPAALPPQRAHSPRCAPRARQGPCRRWRMRTCPTGPWRRASCRLSRSEEHTSELQSLAYLVCRLLLEKKKTPADL